MIVQRGETDNKVSPLFYYIVSILLNDEIIEGGKEREHDFQREKHRL